MKKVIRTYLSGLIILAIAIFVNSFANALGLRTWYGFFLDVSSYGLFNVLKDLSFFSAIFLFIVYPLVLGLSVLISGKLIKDKKQ